MNALLFFFMIAANVAPDSRDLHGCSKEASPNDGAKVNFVWKPADTKFDSKGNPLVAVYFPTTINKKPVAKFKKVQLTKGGKVFDVFKFHELDNEHNDPRQIWISGRAIKSMPANSVLHADSTCWFLKTPSKRID